MRSVKSEYCGQFNIYGHLELALFLIYIVTGHFSYFGIGLGRPIFCTLERVCFRGGAIAMIAYGVCILLIIKKLKTEFPGFTQPWYADNARELVMYKRVEAYVHLI